MTGTPLLRAGTSQHPVRSKSGTMGSKRGNSRGRSADFRAALFTVVVVGLSSSLSHVVASVTVVAVDIRHRGP